MDVMPAVGLIGMSLEECKRLLGEVAKTYSCEGRTDDLEFIVGEDEIVVTPVNDLVLRVHLYRRTPFVDVLEVLERVSGYTGWSQDFGRSIEVTSTL